MCTVVVRVDPGSAWPVTVLALRDESPERPWDPPAAWWPDRDPDLRGVRDRSAGGAWLAASDRAGLAVVLNRAEPVTSVDGTWTTRGVVPVDAVADGLLPADEFAPGAEVTPVTAGQLQEALGSAQGQAAGVDPGSVTVTPDTCVTAVQAAVSALRDPAAVTDAAGQVARAGFAATAELLTVGGPADTVVGTLTDAVETHDVWTFARTLKSSDPNWKLADTDEA